MVFQLASATGVYSGTCLECYIQHIKFINPSLVGSSFSTARFKGSRNGVTEDSVFLLCYSVLLGVQLLAFHRIILPLSSV